MTALLIGRAAALRSLNAAIGDPACGVVTVRGPAGSGKTALAEAALDAAQADGALVGSGKYAQGELQSPFGPIMRAFSQAVGRALDQLHDPEPVTAAMVETLGPALGVLSHTGFRADAAPPADILPAVIGRREGTARVIEASLRLARWLTGFEAPIVLFIDDWRRGAPGARELLAALVSASADLQLTLLLAERDDAPPDLLADDARTRLVEVGALGPADRLAVLETVLGEAGAAVFDWFGPACPALPFDLIAAARALNASGAVTPEADGWRVDPACAASLGRADLARSLVSRLDSLSETVRRVALATALWGDDAPASMLRAATGVTPDAFESAFDQVSALGLLERRGEEVRFLHDRLRDAVLVAGKSDVSRLAGEMAESLAGGARASWAQVGSAALRFRQIAGLEGVDVERWRDRFAQGSCDARAAMDIEAASGFAESAWRLRQIAPPPDTDADRLIVREAVLAAADRKDAAQVRARLAALFLLDSGDEKVGEDYELAIAASRLVGDPASAWALARQGLARFGINLPDKVETRRLLVSIALWRLERLFRSYRDQLASSTTSVDAHTRIANAAAMLAYERSPRTAALVAFQGSRRASRAAKGSAFWLSTDTFLSAMLGDYDQAARLGELAAAAVGLPGYNGFAHAATLNRAIGWGCAWRIPAAELRPRCLEVKALALAEGDLVQAAGAIRNWVLSGWRSAASLPVLDREICQAREEIQRLGDRDVAASIEVILAAVTNLTHPTPPERQHAPGAVDGRPAWARSIPEGGVVVTLELAVARGDWVFAQRFAAANRTFRRNLDNNPRGVDWRFHESLARLKTGSAPRRADLAAIARAARLNPVDHRSKLLILAAERLRARGSAARCVAVHALAVAAAEAGSSRLVAGVACECAADAARESGDISLAETYQRRAQGVWTAWGALAKITTAPMVPADNPLATELADARAQASAADRTARARSRFLADVAHELRTPLQSMQGVLDLAADDPAHLDLAALREVFSSLKTVVNDLTDFGALSSGDAPLDARPVSIAELVRSECSVATPFAAENGASLAVEIDDDVPNRVETDGPRLRQVVRNLLSNAAKYGQGGRTAVRLARSAETSTRSDTLVLTVDDDGPGFTAADLLRLFEPFERGARAGDGLGLGLGLALSRRIAASLGGALQAENRPGGGARFILSFPLITVPDAPEPIASVAQPLRILLAEDLALVRRLIGAILTRQGHEITEAADGTAAASLYRAGDFDLAILDLGMPGMTGLELLALIQKDTEQGRVPPPVILLTASGDEDIAIAARSAGATMVLRKPVSAEELGQAIAASGPVRRPDGSPTSRFTEEMEALKRAARVELRERIERFADRPDGAHAATGAEAHRIAGLAAQFGWPRIAAAADEIEAACLLGGPPSVDAVRLLSLALAALGPEDHASAAGLPN